MRTWLALGGELPVRQGNNRFCALARLAAVKGIPCPQTGPRHSLVSYHLAHFGSAAKTALEAGHSEAMLFAHYQELVTPEAAAEYWAIRP